MFLLAQVAFDKLYTYHSNTRTKNNYNFMESRPHKFIEKF